MVQTQEHPTTGGAADPREPEVITALPVPFTETGDVAMSTYVAMLERVEPHVQAGFVGGTTAEFPALSARERSELLRETVQVFGADRVVCHIGAASLHQVLPLAEDALAQGVRRHSCLTPYYLPCGLPEVAEFYQSVTSALPESQVYVYLFPERSGIDVSPEGLGELTQIDGVVGAKLSGQPNERFAEYVACSAPGTLVYSGDDASYPLVMAAGGSGVVSGVSSVFPERFERLTAALLAGDDEQTRAAQAEVVEAVTAVGPTITRLKLALSLRHDEVWASRMALPRVDEALATTIRDLVARA